MSTPEAATHGDPNGELTLQSQCIEDSVHNFLFVFVKGNGANGYENVLIVADQDDTDIFINGSSTVTRNLTKAGDYYLIEGETYDLGSSNRTMYV